MLPSFFYFEYLKKKHAARLEKLHYKFNASFFVFELICFFSVVSWSYYRDS